MPLNYETDSQYTSRANPRRGYSDYDKTITFDGGTEEERQAVLHDIVKRLDESKPMWRGAPKKTGPNTYVINYGWDSGD